MKKILYTLVLICFANSFTGNAQTFEWVTNDTIQENLALNTTVQLKMEQSAIGSDTVTLGVEIIYNDLPAAWDGMVCVHGLCFGEIPVVGTTATMDVAYGSTYGYTRLTVNPLDGTEVAKLQIYVYDVDFPMDGDTATWLLNETLTVDELSFEQPEVFPNPATDHVEFTAEKDIRTIAVYTNAGTLVEQLSVAEILNSSIDVRHLESGLYTLVFTDAQGNTAVNKFHKL